MLQVFDTPYSTRLYFFFRLVCGSFVGERKSSGNHCTIDMYWPARYIGHNVLRARKKYWEWKTTCFCTVAILKLGSLLTSHSWAEYWARDFYTCHLSLNEIIIFSEVTLCHTLLISNFQLSRTKVAIFRPFYRVFLFLPFCRIVHVFASSKTKGISPQDFFELFQTLQCSLNLYYLRKLCLWKKYLGRDSALKQCNWV